MTALSDMFAAPFMQYAAIALAMLAVTAAIIGVALNLRELEFVSDGLVHAVFPGVVIGFLVDDGGGIGVYLGATIAALLATVLLTLAARRGAGTDAATAVLLAGTFAIGIVIVSRATDYATGLEQLLFGQLLTISTADLVVIGVLGAVAIGLVVGTWKEQLSVSFDRRAAEASGMRVLRYEIVLNIAIALTVVSAARAVGNLLVLALLIVPAAIGRLLSFRLHQIIVIAGAAALGASFAGLVTGYWLSVDARLNVSPSAVLVLVLVAVYLGVAGLTEAVRRFSRGRSDLAAAEVTAA